jgi:hypothetical protein
MRRYLKNDITDIRKNDEIRKKCNNIPIVSQASLLIVPGVTAENIMKNILNINKLRQRIIICFE